MPFVTHATQDILTRRSRILLAGTLGVGKTTACIDAFRDLRAAQPTATMAFLSFPGEKGYDSIPEALPGLTARIWRDDSEKGADSHAIVRAVEKETVLLRAERPTIFVGDGFHKYFAYLLDSVTDGALFRGEDFEPRLYGRAYAQAGDYLTSLLSSSIPVVILTTWTKVRPERNKKPNETAQQAKDIPQKIYPDLPGQLARSIVGEFSIAVVQSLRKRPLDNASGLYHDSLVSKDPSAKPVRVWQTRPHGDVEGVTIKAPREVSEKIPTFVPASYTQLERIMAEAATITRKPSPTTEEA